MDQLQPRLLGYLVVAAIFAVALAFRMRRMARARPLKLERLWIIPAMLVAIAGVTLYQLPPHPADWPWLILALAVGGGLGWLRGSLMKVEIDPGTHAMNMRTSPGAMIFIVALLFMRMGLRTTLAEHAAEWRLSPALITDALLLFAVGLIVVQRVEIFIRGARMLREARQARAGVVSEA
jgi:NAD/NADP transhydrogenase beta subunit